jgi:hypothetical protein
LFAAKPADFRTYVEHFETVVAGARALLPPGEAVTDSEAIALVERTE